MRYVNLHEKPDEVNLQKKLKAQASLFYLRNQIIKIPYTQEQITNYENHLVDIKRKEKLGVLDGENSEFTPEQLDQEALEVH